MRNVVSGVRPRIFPVRDVPSHKRCLKITDRLDVAPISLQFTLLGLDVLARDRHDQRSAQNHGTCTGLKLAAGQFSL